MGKIGRVHDHINAISELGLELSDGFAKVFALLYLYFVILFSNKVYNLKPGPEIRVVTKSITSVRVSNKGFGCRTIPSTEDSSLRRTVGEVTLVRGSRRIP